MKRGDRLAGRYEVKEAIAARDTGPLYHGYDEQIGVEVALRFVDEHLLADHAERQRFLQRARRGKALQHPNILRLYDVVVDGDVVFLVLQWAPGERLSRRLERGPLPLSEARSVIRRVAAGVAHAHQHGVVLGNLATDTVMLYPDDVKLSNVGIGPALPRERFLAAMSHRMEDLAPEVRAGGALEERADVYAVARIARTLLDGDINPAAMIVLERGLGDAALRPRDVEAFVRDLDAALDGRELERGVPVVPTGFDTERVERLPPLPIESAGTRPDAELLSPGERATKSEPLELEASDLVEVPDVTDPGHRRARGGTPPRAQMPVPAPVPSPPPRKKARTFAHPEDDEQTRPHEKLTSPFDADIERGVAAERFTHPEPLPPNMPHPHAMWLPVMLTAAIALSAVGTMYAIRVTQPKIVVVQAPPPVVARPVPAAPPVTTQLPRVDAAAPVAAAPIAAAPTAVTPTVTSLAAPKEGPCPLGMVALSAPKPFCVDLYEYPGGKTIPRTSVSLADARAVCESRSLRLCSDVEWEQACRGPAQGSYPYGSSFDPTRCNAGRGAIAEAGSSPRCRSSAGAYDMSGNVAEWTSAGSQRGGSAIQPAANARCSHIVRGADPAGAPDVGFRCCGDL